MLPFTAPCSLFSCLFTHKPATCSQKYWGMTVPCLALMLLMCGSAQTALGFAKGATTTTLTVTSGSTPVSSVTSGTVVTLTATVGKGGTPMTPGQVNFCDASAKYCTDIYLFGTAQLTSAGKATIKLRPGIGNRSFKAVFLGTKSAATSVSAISTLTVTGPHRTITLIVQTGVEGNDTLTA